MKPSAVLIPIFFKEGLHHILFTRRTEYVRYHKGEISFPGGGYQPEDGSLVNTALRESFEEIGLEAKDVEILGELDDIVTLKSNYIISPFVGSILPEYRFTMSGFECAEVIQIPIVALLQKGSYSEELWRVKEDKSLQPHVYRYQHYEIIGATATILRQFLAIYSEVIGSPDTSL